MGGSCRRATREGTGQMLVPVEAGTNRVQIIFVRTWDRTLGAWISMVAVVFVLVSLKIRRLTAGLISPRSCPHSCVTAATT